MADRPILFSGPMVQALLDGRKTQTRRVLTSARVFATPETKAFRLRYGGLARALQNADCFRQLEGDGWFWEADAFVWQAPARRTGWMAHIGYAPGDRLWVREAWHAARSLDSMPPRDIPRDADIEHAATARSYAEIGLKGKLRPGMFMPRWASRLTLVATDVRIQQLQDISEADAIAEGARRIGEKYIAAGFKSFDAGPNFYSFDTDGGSLNASTAAEAYALLWDRLNANRGYGWFANPWVVAVTFDVLQHNIDARGSDV